MKPASAILVTTLTLLIGCSVTRTEDIHSDAAMVVGKQLTCIYHKDNLYCASLVAKAKDLDKGEGMTTVVSAVHAEESDPDLKEIGSFSTRFSKIPEQYSVWNCLSTGVADPATRCELLREADPDSVARQEAEIQLTAAQEARLQGMTEQDLINHCGAPYSSKENSISRMLDFDSPNAVMVEVKFSTLGYPKSMATIQVENVHGDTTDQWTNFTGIGKSDEDNVPKVREYLPCALK